MNTFSFPPRAVTVFSVAGQHAATALAAACLTLSLGAATADAQNVKEIYRDNCMSCHGEAFAGGSAASLLDDDWVTDGSDRALYDAIYDGLEDAGMPPYRGGLSEVEAWALVVYLREQRDAQRRGQLGESEPDADAAYTTQHHRYRVETVADGLEKPWALDFLPDGTLIFTERRGTLRLVVDGRLVDKPVADTPEVWHVGQGGLLDVAVDPDYDQPGNGWVYLSFSELLQEGDDDADQKETGMTTIVRGRLDRANHRWVDQQVLYRASPKFAQTTRHHFGSRFVFGENNTLFFSVGDRGRGDNAQQLDQPNGKVHRIHRDGSVPQDNPYAPGSAGARKHPTPLPTVWSFGHRNPQGLSMHPATGRLYDVEHGPRGGDEVNLVEPGSNYGWPVVSYSNHYNQTPRGDHPPFHEDLGFVEPVHYWLPSIAQCGSSFYVGDAFPDWQHDLFVAALAKEEVRRVRLSDDGKKVLEDEPIFRGFDRVRDVVPGPDGALYIATEKRNEANGTIYRLVPAD